MRPQRFEWRVSRHYLPHDDAKRVHIRLMRVVCLALHDLRRHPMESSRHTRHLLIVTPANALHRTKLFLSSRETKVCYLALDEVGRARDSLG